MEMEDIPDVSVVFPRILAASPNAARASPAASQVVTPATNPVRLSRLENCRRDQPAIVGPRSTCWALTTALERCTGRLADTGDTKFAPDKKVLEVSLEAMAGNQNLRQTEIQTDLKH